MHVGTAGAGGVYYPAGGALCRMMNRNRSEHGYRCIAESTPGSLSNLRALQKGELDFAVVQSNCQYMAVHGEGQFSGKPMSELRSVFSLYSEPFTVLVRADAPYKTFADIRHARVNLGTEGDSVRLMSEQIFAHLGWRTEDFAERGAFDRGEQGKALCEGKTDVIFYSVGHPNSEVQQATANCALRLLPMDIDTERQLLAHAPYLLPTVIPAGMYPGNPEDVRTVGGKATLVTRAAVPDALVATMLRSVFTNLTSFKTLHPVLAGLEPASMASKGLSAPLHPAAAAFYRAQDMLPDETLEPAAD